MGTSITTTAVHRNHGNVGAVERIASVLAGGALTAYGLQKGSWRGAAFAAFGGFLTVRGITGHCGVYRAIGIATNQANRGGKVPLDLGIRIDASVTVNKSREELYRFWRNLENLPRIMKHIESVKEIDGKRSHWVVKAPAGRNVSWKAEIVNEIPGELIAWRALPGADIDNAGSVHFEAAPDGGTEVRIVLRYSPPGGLVGALVARLFGEEPSQQLREDLYHFKHLMETGEMRKHPGKRQAKASENGHDEVSQSSEESFPASDPPSWTPEAMAH